MRDGIRLQRIRPEEKRPRAERRSGRRRVSSDQTTLTETGPGLSERKAFPPSGGRWQPASHGSRMTDEGADRSRIRNSNGLPVGTSPSSVSLRSTPSPQRGEGFAFGKSGFFNQAIGAAGQSSNVSIGICLRQIAFVPNAGQAMLVPTAENDRFRFFRRGSVVDPCGRVDTRPYKALRFGT